MIKTNDLVKEVWVERNDLVADLHNGYSKDGRLYRQVHVVIPDSALVSPGFEQLLSGIQSTRFHYTHGRCAAFGAW